ncbi:MAG: patatin-like phospholipase family protein [Christensenellales bacterium]
MNKIGLALEGGGAKGAYHVGVVTALYESGYSFDAVVGTSIGALNAAILAQDGLEVLKEF